MMVKDRCHAVTDAVENRSVGAGSRTIQRQVAVNVPPCSVQDFKEVRGIVAIDRQSSRQSGIDMSMSIDESGQDQLAVSIHEFRIRVFLFHILEKTYLPDHLFVYNNSTILQVRVFRIQCENSAISY